MRKSNPGYMVCPCCLNDCDGHTEDRSFAHHFGTERDSMFVSTCCGEDVACLYYEDYKRFRYLRKKYRNSENLNTIIEEFLRQSGHYFAVDPFL